MARLDSLSGLRLSLADLDQLTDAGTFYAAYYGIDIKRLQQKLAQTYLEICPELAWEADHISTLPGPDRRTRVGLVTSYTGDHSIMRCFQALVDSLDRDRFDTD